MKKLNSRRVTIQDVSLKSGVALMTVSRVINAPHLASEKTRKHVESVMSELGYVKNNIASCLASSKEIFCFVLVDSGLKYIDTFKYIKIISTQEMIPCFLTFDNPEELDVNIIKAKSFGRSSMYLLASEANKLMLSNAITHHRVVNLVCEKES